MLKNGCNFVLEKISFDDSNDGSEIEMVKNNQDVSHSILG